MKPLHILIALILLCSIATSMGELNPYTIRVIVWDETWQRAENTSVTFAYGGQEKTHTTAADGTVAFSLSNFKNIPDGAYINISCKYGTKQAPIDYSIGTVGVTFNEPSEDAAISAFEAMGLIAVPTTIAGIYLLFRRKKTAV